jgi:hypothetical protein
MNAPSSSDSGMITPEDAARRKRKCSIDFLIHVNPLTRDDLPHTSETTTQLQESTSELRNSDSWSNPSMHADQQRQLETAGNRLSSSSSILSTMGTDSSSATVDLHAPTHAPFEATYDLFHRQHRPYTTYARGPFGDDQFSETHSQSAVSSLLSHRRSSEPQLELPSYLNRGSDDYFAKRRRSSEPDIHLSMQRFMVSGSSVSSGASSTDGSSSQNYFTFAPQEVHSTRVLDAVSVRLATAPALDQNLADPDTQTVYSQHDLACEFGLANFRYRDYKRAILEKASASHIAFLHGSPEHGLLLQRLPHRMSKRHFAYRLLLIMFHTVLTSGALPSYWKKLDISKVMANVPEWAGNLACDVALSAWTRMRTCPGLTVAEAVEAAQASQR